MADITLTNQAVPLAWPTRGRADNYPWDFDPSQRFTRLKTGQDEWPIANVNVSAPGGWLGLGTAIYPFQPLMEQVAYIHALLKGETRPGPWATGGVAVERTGGIPWQSSQNPVAGLGRKSG